VGGSHSPFDPPAPPRSRRRGGFPPPHGFSRPEARFVPLNGEGVLHFSRGWGGRVFLPWVVGLRVWGVGVLFGGGFWGGGDDRFVPSLSFSDLIA